MAAYVLSQDMNISNLVGTKTGLDTYALGKYKLTIDTDSRYGYNQSVNGAFGSITASNYSTSIIDIDARKVRLVPYTASADVYTPAVGSVVSQISGASGQIIGFWPTITTAPVTSGAIPTSGFIKIRQWNDTPFAAGALTFTSCGALTSGTCTGADVAGWIELAFRESTQLISPRLSTLSVRGEWFELGTTINGVNTFQVPTSGQFTWIAGVFVETAVGADAFEFYPNIVTNSPVGTDSFRGKVCWINTSTGIGTIGNNGTSDDGYKITTVGLRMVIGNVITQCAAATNTTNIMPNTATGTRCTQSSVSGIIVMDKACWALAGYFGSMFSMDVSHCMFTDLMGITKSIDNVSITNTGQGCTFIPVTSYVLGGFVVQSVGKHLTFNDITCARGARNGGPTIMLAYLNEPTATVNNLKGIHVNARTSAAQTGMGIELRNCIGVVATNVDAIGAFVGITTGSLNSKMVNVRYADVVSGTTATTYPQGQAAIIDSSSSCTIDGISIPITNTHPYAPVGVIATNCINCMIVNAGSKASPLDAGTVNKVVTIFAGGGGVNNKIKRSWATSCATNFMMLNSNIGTGWVAENCGTMDYTGAININSNNSVLKGIQGAVPTLSGNIHGTHIADRFTSTTTGALYILCAPEPLSAQPSASTCKLFGGAPVPSTLFEVGQYVEYEWSYYAIGHTGFANTTMVVVGNSLSNLLFNYKIDKNDGNGWTQWQVTNQNEAAIRALLVAEAIPDASKGFKLAFRIYCAVASGNTLTSVSIGTTSSALAQSYEYPLSVATVTVNSLVTGSMVKATMVDAPYTVLDYGVETGGIRQFTTEYIGYIEIEARQGTTEPYYQPWITRGTTVADATITATALQQLDQ